ncbi:centrosomal protein of 104 kDa isoform X1 [Solea solea]|uniref:centrosomal protein of 104 kDa isoform X1 n=1 Tax=Solea solea TaxID=90069 RepID=UPI00272D211C|nr:centrosomal protein of 104 kDa isoform X1 [Solea solea]XP_058498820.1 centrosomal protein of 104 kDa isoform X1 [Solea solea]XP_058498821.1 centrosomal protein of 104 kDa isoform X1 [Solea solea]
MPRKIGFIVANSSSHEDKFVAKELMVHAPTANGWRSSRLCSYPQHITLQLVERSRVRKLQLLAHQYLIPSKVEFHIGDTIPETSSPGFPGQLRRLGYVSLSDNEKTDFKARELKSVHVDAIGTYLRITFHKNHINGYNHHNQVALVAINVLGDSLDGNAFNTIPSREQLIEHYLNSTQLDTALDTTFMGKCESFSPFDDLAFEMYQDPEVAHIIRLMDQKKQEMVQQEKYELAKNLKQAIADLQKVGERLARYDVEKRCAIEKEDYDLAKKKKELMENYRRSVYKQLEVHNLLDMTMVTRETDPSPLQDPPPLLPSPGHCSAPTEPPVSTDSFRKEKKTNTPPNQQSATETIVAKPNSQPENPCTPAALPKIDLTIGPYDERPLPALQRKDNQAEALQSPPKQHAPQLYTMRSLPNTEISGEPEQLTEKAQREAALPIDVYGESLVAGVYSKTWSYREDALLAVYKKLSDVSPTTPKEELRNMMRSAVFLVKKALSDKVSSVFQAALKLLRLMLGQLIPVLGLGRSEVIHCFEQTWPNLLARTGDSASRFRVTATAFIQEIAVLKEVRALQLIPGELAKPFKSNFPSRLAQSRAELLEMLLAELGALNSGFTLDNVMMFCTAALEHSAAEVREPAMRIILSMYKQHGSAALSYLPPNDSATRKNFLYKTLFDGFAKIDGKLVETQTQTTKKGGGQQHQGQKEKEKIHSLQEQLAALKEITERDSECTKGQMPKKDAPKDGTQPHRAAKATVSQLPQNTVAVQQSVSYQDNLCIFCGKKDESFTEDGLDLHYWKHCPMLRHCGECRQIVEIASLTEHLLGDCESSSKFSACPRCSEAVATEGLARHVQGPSCSPSNSSNGSNHCPLCHNNFAPGEEAWKAHLMGRDGCKQNSRRTVVSQRTQPAQGRAVGAAKLQQGWPVGLRGRGRGRGSRIPALAPVNRGHMPGKR